MTEKSTAATERDQKNLALLRAAVVAKLLYWDASRALELALTGDDISDKRANELTDTIDILAAGIDTPEAAREFVTSEMFEDLQRRLALTRHDAIQAELYPLGYKMENSLAALEGEGDAIIELATGESVDPPNNQVLRLAEEWSILGGAVQDA